MYKNISEDQLEELATEEQKQIAASVAIDSYDKTETYFDELKRLIRNDQIDMNKILLIYKSGETVPLLIVRCDEYRTDAAGIFIKRDNVEHFLSLDWSYYNEIEVGENGEKIVDLFKHFQDEIKKYEN